MERWVREREKVWLEREDVSGLRESQVREKGERERGGEREKKFWEIETSKKKECDKRSMKK